LNSEANSYMAIYNNSKNILKYALPILLIISIALYLTYPLLTGEYIYPLGEYEIYKSFIANFIDTLKHLELPVWNEYVGGGHPAMYFGHYPITQNTLFYMLFGANDFTYYFMKFVNLAILLASFVYAGKILKFGYLTSLIGALVYFSINFVSKWLVADTIGNLILVYPLLIVLLFQIIKDRQWKTILIFNAVYIFWLTGGHITYVYQHLMMLSIIYWIGVYVIDLEPLKLKNLKKFVVLYFILFILPIAAVLYQYYFVYDVIKASNKIKEGLIVSPFESIVWQQLWGSFKSSSYFWIGLVLIPLSFIRKSVQIPKIITAIITIIATGLLSYIIIAGIQITSTSNIVSDYIPILNSNDFRVALLLYVILSQLIFSRYSLPAQVSVYSFVIFAVYVSLLSHYFYSPGNIAGMDHGLFMELSVITRTIFVLCILFSMQSYRKNKIVKIMIISLIVLYLIRSHFTIPLMRFAGIVWYPTRDGVSFSALFAFLFMFGLKNLMTDFYGAILKRKSLKHDNVMAAKSVCLIMLLVFTIVMVHDSFNKFYNGQTNKVVFPNQIHLTNTAREVGVLKSREEIPILNGQLLDLDKTAKHFYRIFAPEAVFVYLSGYLQDHKIRDAAIYESSISKDYKDFFDYTILGKTVPDSKEIKNILTHAVFTKHVHAGFKASIGEIPYHDVYLVDNRDVPYLRSQDIEFFWDLMQVKYLIIGSAFSKALEGFSDKENYKLLGSYLNLDLNLYEITKKKTYSRLGILPVEDEQDFEMVMGKINSGDVDVLRQVYEKVIYLDADTKDFTLLKSQIDRSRRYYEIDAKRKGILIEFESWNKHWGLNANGEKKNVYKVFHILRGIKIESGINKIEMNYRVPYFKEMFWLSVFALLLYGYLLVRLMIYNNDYRKTYRG